MSEKAKVPEGLRYTAEHEWIRVEGDVATVGITDHAQQALGEITYVELPPVGKQVLAAEELAAVESAKAASDVFAPLAGAVAEVNEALEDAPEQVNQDPYGEGWICKIKLADPAEAQGLMDAAQYCGILEKEGQEA